MIKLLLIIIACLTFQKGIGQADTISLYESAKYLLIAEQKSPLNLETFNSLFLPHIKSRKLNSNGFDHVKFILMEYRGTIDNNIPDSAFKRNMEPHSCDYVVAFVGGIFFRLKGFVNNDFYQFIEYYSENADSGFVLKKNVFLAKNLNSFRQKIKNRNIFIEDLDIDCYYKYFLIQQRAQKMMKNNFCSESCIYNQKR
jgi:hypothetical protein